MKDDIFNIGIMLFPARGCFIPFISLLSTTLYIEEIFHGRFSLEGAHLPVAMTLWKIINVVLEIIFQPRFTMVNVCNQRVTM